MSGDLRIELVTRLNFILQNHRAALEFSRNPWVQVAKIFGVLQTPNAKFPILVSCAGTSESLDVFVFRRNKWKKLERVRAKELDPEVVIATLKELLTLSKEKPASAAQGEEDPARSPDSNST